MSTTASGTTAPPTSADRGTSSEPAFRPEAIPEVDRREDRVVISAALFDDLTRNVNATAGELRAPAPGAFQGTVPLRTSVPSVPCQGFVPVPTDTNSVPTSSAMSGTRCRNLTVTLLKPRVACHTPSSLLLTRA